jgi:beta-glucanase (GH16 family)
MTWQLIWSDEFNGTSLNTANWTYDTGTGSGGWGNNELEYYTNRPQNVQVVNGNLVITALKESYGGVNYTSARIKTKGLQTWTYGKIEARMKIPVGQGIWPAFWMLGSNIDGVGWPACGEIDIMEHVNNTPTVQGTMHWDNNGHASYGTASPALDFSQYHVYSVEWDTSSIKWFVDGTQYLEGNILNNINGTNEFHNPFFILFNLAVGGNWPGNPDGSTVFPAQMYVDYVRVYRNV